MHYSTKTYGHERGLSCCFRQWRADSHCNLLHGYALSFRFVFKAEELDERNWVIDFGGLKTLEQELKRYFDHTLIVAKDDPLADTLLKLESEGLANIYLLSSVGCEAFAKFAYELAYIWLSENGHMPRVQIHEVEVKEHNSNGAIFKQG